MLLELGYFSNAYKPETIFIAQLFLPPQVGQLQQLNMIPVLNTAMCLMSCFVRVSEACALEMAFGGGAAPGPASPRAHTP